MSDWLTQYRADLPVYLEAARARLERCRAGLAGRPGEGGAVWSAEEIQEARERLAAREGNAT